MSETSGKDTDLIAPDVQKIFDAYNWGGMGKDADIVYGPECEFFLVKANDKKKIEPISFAEAQDFKAYFNQKAGVKLAEEAIASHFELNYGPMNLDNFKEKFEDYFKNVRALYKLADEKGCRVVPSSHAPHIEGLKEVIDQMAPKERMKVMVPMAPKYLGDDILVYANTTAGIHVSSGYKDTEQLYMDVRRSYYLSPFVAALSNNGLPFWKGGDVPTGGASPRMAAIEKVANDPQGRGRTGVDPVFYEAVDGEDFLKRYIDWTIHAPMLMYREKTRSVKEVFAGKKEPGLHKIDDLGASVENPVSFVDLEKHGLNTGANLQNTESTKWFHVKIAPIHGLDGENGKPLKRREDRIWNAGTWQIATSLIMHMLMGLEPECGKEVDDLLSDFGFRPEGPAAHPKSGEYLKEATKLAAEKGGTLGLNFKYGTGTAQEFGQKFTAILQKYAKKHGLEGYLAPMEYITRTNNTDARVLAEVIETPEDQVAFIQSYDVETLPVATMSYGMLKDAGMFPNPAADRKGDMQNNAQTILQATRRGWRP